MAFIPLLDKIGEISLIVTKKCVIKNSMDYHHNQWQYKTLENCNHGDEKRGRVCKSKISLSEM